MVKFLLSLKLKLPLVQSNLHTIEAYLAVASSGPPQFLPLKLPWKFHLLKSELVAIER